MKKLLSLTSVALLGVVALTGCSCGKNGTYSFSHVEYKVGDKTETTNCEDITNLDLVDDGAVIAACGMGKALGKFVIDGNKMYPEGEEDDAAFIKIEDGKIMASETEDGEYRETGFTYKSGKIIMGEDDVSIVWKK
ncbi:MAG: hypothetical protein IKJ30_06850 [Bacilli bacterium]|nr:hypothetical protein [Bacilli bacterium]